MIPLLLDAGLPRSTARDLRGAGWDVEHVADLGMGAATDRAIVGAAVRGGRTVVTLDNDFPQLLFLSGATRPSVLLLRVEGLDRERATTLLRHVVPLVLADLFAGAVVSVTDTEARVRPLPLR